MGRKLVWYLVCLQWATDPGFCYRVRRVQAVTATEARDTTLRDFQHHPPETVLVGLEQDPETNKSPW